MPWLAADLTMENIIIAYYHLQLFQLEKATTAETKAQCLVPEWK
jgi:hypothetical protein